MSTPRKFEPPPPEVVQALRAEAERVLTPEEVQQYLSVPVSAEEAAETDALIDWFLRRYPTPAARLAHGRKWTLRLRRALPEGALDASRA